MLLFGDIYAKQACQADSIKSISLFTGSHRNSEVSNKLKTLNLRIKLLKMNDHLCLQQDHFT